LFMKKMLMLTVFCIAILVGFADVIAQEQAGVEYRRISVDEYLDKMKGGWFGQMAGVAWAAPTEWKSKYGGIIAIMPETGVPKYMKPWNPGIVNGAFGQDDIYVEMTFLATMEKYGYDCSIRQAGIDFANSRYNLWGANVIARNNLRSGIAPPDCSHPKFHSRPNALDYQIEADYSGLIAPGMPNVAIQMGEKFGRIMNYADGLYSGQFVGAMYAEAYFETDMRQVVEKALKAIPAQSYLAEMINDMLKWSKQYSDWKDCFNVATDKYWDRNKPGLAQTQPPAVGKIDCLDVRGNMAYVLMGLLYGDHDFYKTVIISAQCGVDSDCNPSTAAGVLLTSIGFKNLPKELTSKLNRKAVFSNTNYSFDKIIKVCQELTRQAVVREGGRIVKSSRGQEFIIPIKAPMPSKLQRGWEPGPMAGNTYFTDKELPKAVKKWTKDWHLGQCKVSGIGGLAVKKELKGKKNVLITHTWDNYTPCFLTRDITLPPGKKSKLSFSVSNPYKKSSSWRLLVAVNMVPVLDETISEETQTDDGWRDIEIDLSEFAGKTIMLELYAYPTKRRADYNCWADLKVQ